ncbi:glycoside hydrolase domain-containing protein [Rathayibacter rathayi]|nr:glycoside hydrolase domain-containing protein [Rathayibacter rathayi]
MFALTRALQHELGITSLSDNFGETTFARLAKQFPTVSSKTVNKGILGIVQAALWCKGYGGMSSPDGKWTVWDSTTTTSIARLNTNIGLPAAAEIIPKLFKSLLTMDAYILLPRGSQLIRSIQRSLNARYNGRSDFFLIPCDGIYSRDVQVGLMYGLQYEIGMADGTANGYLGPGTKAGLSSSAANVGRGSSDSSQYFVHLFQAALAFNGSYDGEYDGVFSEKMTANVKSFQDFTMLPQSGRADWKTWASLLASTGDPERMDSAKAVDCITTITAARASTLKANGYSIVGRYLTNTPNTPDPTDKNIKPGEISTIFASGLRVFPIFQEGGGSASFFDAEKGRISGRRAHFEALKFGFKPGTVIYFTVDFDAVEDEVDGKIVPYFEAISMAFRGSQYRIGVYGARNTCSIVSSKNYATYSFVSGMSTGYSGNLGFRLPVNWAFDQIKEYTVGSGNGAIGIDKDIYSGRDAAQPAVSRVPNKYTYDASTKANSPAGYDDLFYGRIARMQYCARYSLNGLTTEYNVNHFVLTKLQKPRFWYNGGESGNVWAEHLAPDPAGRIGVSNSDKASFAIKAQDLFEQMLADAATFPEPDASTWFRFGKIDHWAVSTRTYMIRGEANDIPSNSDNLTTGDLASWALDLVTLWNDYEKARVAAKGTLGKGVRQWIAENCGVGSANHFAEGDLRADMSAYLIAKVLVSDRNRTLDDVVREHSVAMEDDPGWLAKQFVGSRFGGSSSKVVAAAKKAFTEDWLTVVGWESAVARKVFLTERAPGSTGGHYDPSATVRATEIQDIADGFADALDAAKRWTRR